jgi:hypothetical protein
MGAQGEDIRLSPKARERFPFSIECKNIAAFAGYKFYEQAVENSGEHIPIVVVKANRQQPLVLMDAEEFIRIMGKHNE